MITDQLISNLIYWFGCGALAALAAAALLIAFYALFRLYFLENVRHTYCYTSFLQRIQAKAR